VSRVDFVIEEGNEAAVCCASQNQTTQIMIVTLVKLRKPEVH